MWILAAKLPNSDLNFAVDFLVDFFLLSSPRKSTKKNPQKKIHPELCSEKFPSDFCRSLFLRHFSESCKEQSSLVFGAWTLARRSEDACFGSKRLAEVAGCLCLSRVRKKGSFGKGFFFREVHFLEILENLVRNEIQPKEEVFGRTSLRTSRQKLRSGLPNPGKTSISELTSHADVHEKTSV